jgi:hypothetical protein
MKKTYHLSSSSQCYTISLKAAGPFNTKKNRISDSETEFYIIPPTLFFLLSDSEPGVSLFPNVCNFQHCYNFCRLVTVQQSETFVSV